MYRKSVPFPCNQVVVYLLIPSEASLRLSEHRFFFPGWGRYPHAQNPTWRTRVSLFVWVITFDLSGLGDPASSYATAGLALRIIWPHKPHHYVKVETPSGGKESNIVQHKDSTSAFAGRDCVKQQKILGSRCLIFDSNRALPKYKIEVLLLTTSCSAPRPSGLFFFWSGCESVKKKHIQVLILGWTTYWGGFFDDCRAMHLNISL